jgi:hypothetical protein
MTPRRASLDGNVRWLLGFGHEPRCEVLGYEVIAGENDMFDNLGDAYSQLPGPLQRIHEVSDEDLNFQDAQIERFGIVC